MKINKNKPKIWIMASVVFGLVCFGSQALALSQPILHSTFAVVAPATGGGDSTTTQSTDQCQLDPGNCNIVQQYIDPLIKFLSALVGIVVVIGIVIGGIQYSSARDNPQAVGAAKKRITNAILALIVYFFLFALLNFLIPGGLL